MKCEIVYKRGKPYIRVDFRPSKRIRRAKERISKRQREIQRHLENAKQ